MNRGFTLIELLVSTMLAVMLAAGVLAVVASLGRTEQAMVTDHQGRWPASLAERVRFDLINGRKLMSSPNILEIQGYGGLNAQTGEPNHAACTVRYTIQQVESHPWLVRTQSAAGTQTERELAAVDIAAITIRPVVVEHRPSQSLAGHAPTTKPVNGTEIPSQMELVVRSSDPSISVLDEVFTLR